MNTKASWVLSAAMAVAGPLGVTAAVLAPSVAVAQQKVSAKVGVPLKAAQEAVQKKNWNGALAKIKEAQAVSPRTAYDDYMINELLWYVYLQQGRNADAARLLEQQIASGQMPAGEKVQRTKTLAQLQFRGGQLRQGDPAANQYLKSAPGDREMQLLVAQAYFQQKDYKSAVADRRAHRQGPGAAERGPAAADAALQLRAQRRGGHRAHARAAAQVLPEPGHLGPPARAATSSRPSTTTS